MDHNANSFTVFGYGRKLCCMHQETIPTQPIAKIHTFANHCHEGYNRGEKFVIPPVSSTCRSEDTSLLNIMPLRFLLQLIVEETNVLL